MNRNLLITAAVTAIATLTGCGLGQDDMQTKYHESLEKQGIDLPLEDKQKKKFGKLLSPN